MKAAELFDIKGKVVVLTGATGALTGSVAGYLAAGYLAAEGARVACLGRNQGKLDVMIARLRQTIPDAGLLSVVADVCEQDGLERACDAVLERWGRVDGLLNGAGGEQPGAVLPPDQPLEALDFAAFREVVDVNLHGTVLPTLVFARAMQAAGMASVIRLLGLGGTGGHPRRGIFGGESGHREFHPLAGGGTGGSIYRPGARQCPGSGVFPG